MLLVSEGKWKAEISSWADRSKEEAPVGLNAVYVFGLRCWGTMLFIVLE